MTVVTDAEVEAGAQAAYFEMNSVMHDHEKLWRTEDALKRGLWRDVARSVLIAAARARPAPAAEGEVGRFFKDGEDAQKIVAGLPPDQMWVTIRTGLLRRLVATPKASEEEIRNVVELIAKIPLWRDAYPDGPEIFDGNPQIKVEQVRAARAMLARFTVIAKEQS